MLLDVDLDSEDEHAEPFTPKARIVLIVVLRYGTRCRNMDRPRMGGGYGDVQ